MANTSTSRPARSRLRARKACIPCRVRKRKCDANFPCGMCETYSYDCQYALDDGPAAAFTPRHAAKSRKGSSPRSGHRPTRHQIVDAPKPVVDPGILDPTRLRFVGQSSVIAFPRILDESLGSQQPLGLRSFGWNLGTRPEEMSEDVQSLVSLITRDELDVFSSTFFTILGPIFDIVDQRSFSAQCLALYTKGESDYAFGAVVAGVVALGSLFSSAPHVREPEIVRAAKRILEDPICTRRPSADQIVGWILRTLYVRATTRPNNAWLASSTMMHLVEAVGLHNDPAAIPNTAPETNNSDADSMIHRRIFWCAWCLNKIISYEYSRTSIMLPQITCKPIPPVVGSFMLDWIRVVQTIPDSHGEHESFETISHSLHQLAELRPGHAMCQMTKADVAFCFFRRLRHLGVAMPPDIVEILLEVGRNVIKGAADLNHGALPWWNVLGTVFQYICVLLALDTPTSMSGLPTAMTALKTIADVVNTHLAREALATAKLLVRAAMTKKNKELSSLEQSLSVAGEENQSDANANITMTNGTFPIDDIADFDFDLDGFLNEPYLFNFTDADLQGPSSLSFV